MAATFTSSRRALLVPRRQRHAVIGRPLGGLDGAGAEHLDYRTVEQLVQRAADGILVPHAVELFQLSVPADDSAVAIEHRQPVVQRLENVLAELPHPIDLVGLGPQLTIEPAVFERRRRLRGHRREKRHIFTAERLGTRLSTQRHYRDGPFFRDAGNEVVDPGLAPQFRLPRVQPARARTHRRA